jgi:type I restriction enzyme M protein
MTDLPLYLKPFDHLFTSLAGKHRAYQIFDDFLRLSVCGLSYGSMETQRMEVLKRYEPSEQAKLWAMFEALMGVYANKQGTKGWIDPLGTYYEYISSKGHKQDFGQFFTPESLCDLMATLATSEAIPTGKLFNDPACGSGRLLLSMHAAYPFNYLVASDLDFTCVMMAAINLCLHGARGEVIWKDALQPNEYRRAFGFGCISILRKPLPIIWEIEDGTQRSPAPLPRLSFETFYSVCGWLLEK